MPTPRIAVTGMWSNQIHGLRKDGSAISAAILRSVVRAGGEPLMLFAESAEPARERLRGFDGVLIPGGADIQPARYGQQTGPRTQTADNDAQDQFEAEILAAATQLGLPILAICRGFQLTNVERGGTLVQDLPAESVHRNGTHEVHIEADSVLSRALHNTTKGNTISVSSYHHQTLGRLGEHLTVVGTAPDGIIEAVEDPSVPLLAVQWHPEDTAEHDATQHALFAWLIANARAHGVHPNRTGATDV